MILKFGPWHSSISISWELTSCKFPVPSQSYRIRDSGGGGGGLEICFKKPSRWLRCKHIFEEHWSVHHSTEKETELQGHVTQKVNGTIRIFNPCSVNWLCDQATPLSYILCQRVITLESFIGLIFPRPGETAALPIWAKLARRYSLRPHHKPSPSPCGLPQPFVYSWQ